MKRWVLHLLIIIILLDPSFLPRGAAASPDSLQPAEEKTGDLATSVASNDDIFDIPENASPLDAALESQISYLNAYGQIGGSSMAVATQGNYAYVDVGPRLLVIDITNPADLILVGQTEIVPALVSDIWLEGNLLYLADGVGGLQIVDVSTPATPHIIGALPTARNSLGVSVAGDYAYIANSDGGVRIVNVSNPAQPVEAGVLSLGAGILARDSWAVDSYAYAAASLNGLYTIDVHDPANPFTVTLTAGLGNVQGLYGVGNYLYVAAGGSLVILDITSPSNPTYVRSVSIPAGNGVGVFVSEGYAYVAAMDGGLQIFNVSDPYHPFWAGSYTNFDGVFNVSVLNQKAYLAAGIDDLQIIDVSNPATPKRLGKGYVNFGKTQGLFFSGNYAYVGAAQDGLWIVDITDPANLADIGFRDLDGNCRGVELSGNYAYLACGIGGMYILDMTNIVRPTVTGWISTTLSADGYRELNVISDTVYVADWGGILKIDVSQPMTPTITDQHAMSLAEPHAIHVVGNYAYLGTDSGLYILDITQPLMPEVGSLTTISNTWDVQVVDNIAYLAAGGDGLWIVDVSDPANPQTIATYSVSQYTIGIYVDQGVAYLACGLGGVRMIDVHNPQNPIEINAYDSPGYTEYVYYQNNVLYLADGGGGLFSLNVFDAVPSLAPDVGLGGMTAFTGEGDRDLAGSQATALGDINGDGIDDFAVTASEGGDGDYASRGTVYILFGKTQGWPSRAVSLKTADASFYGEVTKDNLGFSIAGVGDVNNDSLNDILVGAPGNDQTGSSAGKSYLIFGNSDPAFWQKNVPITDKAGASFLGEMAGDKAGAAIASAGDVNGDTFPDFLIGAHDNDQGGADAGQVYLLLGKETGWSLDTPLAHADASFFANAAGVSAGESLAGVGDVNGDTYDDFLIGAWLDSSAATGAGQAYLIQGKATGWHMDILLSNSQASYLGEGPNHWAGYSVAGVGDVNGDTYDDFLIGAPGVNDRGPKTGTAYLILGKVEGWAMSTSLASADASFRGEAMGDWAGRSVAAAGDVNQDGYDDLFIAAHRNDDGGRDAGQVYLVLGKASGWTLNTGLNESIASYWGEASYDFAGQAIANIGDVDANGFTDLAVGAPYYDKSTLQDAGKVYLIFGNNGPAAGTFIPVQPFQEVNVYHSLNTNYLDLVSGSNDLQDVRLTLQGGGKTVTLRYSQSERAFYMSTTAGWLGPCPRGEPGTLNNGTFELNCQTSSARNDGPSVLTINWRLRVVQSVTWPYTLNATRQAWDLSAQGSQPRRVGFWAIAPGAPVIDLSVTEASYWGEAANDQAGWAVASAGDVNNDGLNDFLIGAPDNSENGTSAGQVYLFLGRPEGWTADLSLVNANASFLGEAAKDYAGFSLAGVGDVNNDGFDDFLIGAFGNSESGYMAGQAYLILGKASGWSMDTPLSLANASFTGEDDSDYAGFTVAAAGDVNNDGFADFLIGAWGDENLSTEQAGSVYLILGKESGWAMDTSLTNADASFLGEDGDDWAGYALAGIGDTNKDGYDDFLIAAPNDEQVDEQAGQVYLILGKQEGWAMNTSLANADASFLGEAKWHLAGIAVSSAGDVNGDGYADFLIGAEGANGDIGPEAGQTYLLLGKAEGWSLDTPLTQADGSFVGERAYDRAGRALATLGDVTGDGFSDFAIGATGADDGGSNAGKLYLIMGHASTWGHRANLSQATKMYWGENPGDRAGISIAGLYNLTGEGDHALLIGASGNQTNGQFSAGQAYLTFPDLPLPPPDLQSVFPSTITNEVTQTLTLTGLFFQPVPTVTVGTTPLETIFVNTQTLTTTVPAGFPSGVYTVTVTNPDENQDWLTDALTVTSPAPDLQAVDPSILSNEISQVITLTGLYFQPTPTITLGTAPLETSFVNSETITTTVPADFPTGVYTVTLTNPDGKFDTLPEAITITLPAPDLMSVEPISVTNDVDNVITLHGLYFQSMPTVTLGTTSLTVTFINSQTLTVTVPAEFPAGVYDITIINPDNQWDVLTNALTVLLYIEPIKWLYLPLILR